jgi:hypothetical protein
VEGRRDCPQHGARVGRDAVDGHQLFGVGVVGLHRGWKRSQPGAEHVKCGDLRARALGEDVDQAEVVHVLVRDHDQPQVFDPVPVLGEIPR